MNRNKLLLLTLILVSPLLLEGQDVPQPGDVIDTIYTRVDLFEQEDPLRISLTFDLKHYQRNKHRDEYLPVNFTYRINDTLRLEKEMRIKPRGNFRRDHCLLAPFWLNIKKSRVSNRFLQDIKKIKIVTHCGDSRNYQDYLLREYLAYKIYNLLSPVSFRVRLIDMTYINTGRKGREIHSWAFMIEPEELLAERHQAVVIKKDDLSMRLMEPEAFDLVAQFMYMIGNADYSVVGRHNLKILGIGNFGSRGFTPVPYDFDYSGLVDASYAHPSENLGIRSVRERYYLGLCREDEAYRIAIDKLDIHREEIQELVRSFPYLDEKEKEQMMGYLESYFEAAANPARLIRSLKSTCR